MHSFWFSRKALDQKQQHRVMFATGRWMNLWSFGMCFDRKWQGSCSLKGLLQSVSHWMPRINTIQLRISMRMPKFFLSFSKDACQYLQKSLCFSYSTYCIRGVIVLISCEVKVQSEKVNYLLLTCKQWQTGHIFLKT